MRFNVSNASDLTRLFVPWDYDRGSNDPGGRHAVPFARCFHDGKNAKRAGGTARRGSGTELRRKERASSASEED